MMKTDQTKIKELEKTLQAMVHAVYIVGSRIQCDDVNVLGREENWFDAKDRILRTLFEKQKD
jgi:hypothetical protein